MKLFITTLAFLCTCLTVLAQPYTLSGTISNENGRPVPFASIVIKGTSKGTSANSEGHYALSLAGGNYELFYKAIGYKQVNHNVHLTANRVLNVTLGSETYALNNVTIRAGGEDPAYAIIRKAIKKRKYYLNQISNYSCYTYIKVLQRSLGAPKKFMGQDLNKVARENGLDSNRRGIMYFSESESKLDFKQPNLFHEEMISSKVSGDNKMFSFNRAYALQINFYQNQQNWPGLSNRGVISPIADNALSYYNYKWMGITVENGLTINKIQVMPKRNYDPVFEGYIYIIDDTWRLYSANLTITKKAGINFLDTLNIKEQFAELRHDTWVPSNIGINFSGGFFQFKFGGYLTSFYRDYDLDPKFDDKEFREKMRITADVMKKDSTYWNTQRPTPLTDEEKTDYQKKAVIAKRHESKEYLDSVDKAENHIGPVNILFSGIRVRNRYRNEFVFANSLAQSFLYNTVEGAAFNYSATYLHKIDTASNRFVQLTGKLRYGFVNQRFNASVNGTLPAGEYRLGFNLGSDVLDMNNQSAISPLINTVYSLFERQNYQKLYEKHFGAISLSRRIAGALQASVTAEYANRIWLPNTSYYSFFHRERQYTSNNPFTPQQDIPLFPENQSFKLNVHASYDFSRQYVTYPTGRFYLPSKYPRIEVSYTRAIPNVFNADADYELLTASVSKTDMVLGNYGKFSFYVGAGKFLTAHTLYYTDYKHFTGSLTAVNLSSNLNSFLLLDNYRYSTPNQYLEAHLEHNFGGLLLAKLPLLQRLKLQEIVNFNYLTTPQLKNYSELAVGLQYFAFRAMYGWSYNRQDNARQAFRISLTFR